MEEYDCLEKTRMDTVLGKCPHSVIEKDEDMDSDEDYERLQQSLPSVSIFNEYNHYVQLSQIECKIQTLEFWRQSCSQFSKLSRMA